MRAAFVSPCTQLCLKALQDRKLVFLCVVDKSAEATAEAAAIPQGVQEFKADARYAGATEIVLLNARDESEAAFAHRRKTLPTEAFDMIQLAEGIENLQIDCETDGGLGVLGPCPGVIPPAPMSRHVEEAKPSGLAGATGGPRFAETSISSLRMVHLMLVARNLLPVTDGRGDDPIAIGNQVALFPAAHPGPAYTRRLYRMVVGVRNTSLGAF